MARFWYRYGKAVSLIGGFVSTLVGIAWTFLVASALDGRTRGLVEHRADLIRQIDHLRAASSEYFLANQQGDLVFILAQQDDARTEIAAQMHRANLLDRATPVRNMILELALAKQLDYRQTYDTYEKQNELLRKDFTLPNFQQLKQTEKTIMVQGQNRAGKLVGEVLATEQDLAANDEKQKHGRLLGFTASILGSFLLLMTNLTTEKYKYLDDRPGG